MQSDGWRRSPLKAGDRKIKPLGILELGADHATAKIKIREKKDKKCQEPEVF